MAGSPVMASWRVTTLTGRYAASVVSGGSITGSGAMAGALCDALEAKDGRILGVMDGDAAGPSPELVGYLWLARLPFDAEIQALGVHPERRGQGVGDALMRAALETARDWQCEHLLLEVREGNAAAIALYRRHGLDVDGRRRGYYPPATPDSAREDALLMSRCL